MWQFIQFRPFLSSTQRANANNINLHTKKFLLYFGWLQSQKRRRNKVQRPVKLISDGAYKAFHDSKESLLCCQQSWVLLKPFGHSTFANAAAGQAVIPLRAKCYNCKYNESSKQRRAKKACPTNSK